MPGFLAGITRRHRHLSGGLALLVLASVLALVYARHAGRPALSASLPPLGADSVTLVPGIHYLGALFPSAVYAVETSEGLVLVDAGLEADAGPLKTELARLGLDGKGIRAVLLTHAHADHSQGAQHFHDAGATVYAGQGDAAALRDGGPPTAFISIFDMPEVVLHPTAVDVELHGEEVIAFGDARFRVLATPGHTPGSVCYLLERNRLRVLFSGDVVMALAGGVTDVLRKPSPLGTYSAYLPPCFRGNARDYLTSLRTLRALPVPDLVLPSHPRLDRKPRSPCLPQERWEAILDDGIAEMETLLARYKRDGANFLDGNPKKLLKDLYYLGDFAGEAAYAFRAPFGLFVVATPSRPGLLDFVHGRLEQLGAAPAAPAALLLTSPGPQETAGLADWVQKSRSRVVASAAALRQVRQACPAGTAIIPAEELPAQGWFDVRPVALAGRGVAPVAYKVLWEGKKLLFSGRIPIRLRRRAGERLMKDLAEAKGNGEVYAASLDQLAGLRPDLWLTAIPEDGQNANVYDGEWEQIIADNRAMLRAIR
jgi:glyoxylase-like metal-dependent hydrolase (beta-lactamase superfamily II)